jgi:hypothetical protein
MAHGAKGIEGGRLTKKNERRIHRMRIEWEYKYICAISEVDVQSARHNQWITLRIRGSDLSGISGMFFGYPIVKIRVHRARLWSTLEVWCLPLDNQWNNGMLENWNVGYGKRMMA